MAVALQEGCQNLPLEDFVNEVVLERNHTRLFSYCLGLLLCYAATLVLVAEITWPATSKIFTVWPFAESVRTHDAGVGSHSTERESRSKQTNS